LPESAELYLQQTVSVGVLKCVGQVQGYVKDIPQQC